MCGFGITQASEFLIEASGVGVVDVNHTWLEQRGWRPLDDVGVCSKVTLRNLPF